MTADSAADKDAPDVGDKLRNAMIATEGALRERWARGMEGTATVYSIDIPAQSLTVTGEEFASNILKTLKGAGVKGTYRIKKGGANEGNRS